MEAVDMLLMGEPISSWDNPHREHLGYGMCPMVPDLGVVFMFRGTNVPNVGVGEPVNH